MVIHQHMRLQSINKCILGAMEAAIGRGQAVLVTAIARVAQNSKNPKLEIYHYLNNFWFSFCIINVANLFQTISNLIFLNFFLFSATTAYEDRKYAECG